MVVSINTEVSIEVYKRLSFIDECERLVKSFFRDKNYGNDLEIMYIDVFCKKPYGLPDKYPKPIFKEFVPARKFPEGTLPPEQKVLTYSLPLDYEIYSVESDLEKRFAAQLIGSLDVIKSKKKIKDFDFDSFKKDFEGCIQNLGWL